MKRKSLAFLFSFALIFSLAAPLAFAAEDVDYGALVNHMDELEKAVHLKASAAFMDLYWKETAPSAAENDRIIIEVDIGMADPIIAKLWPSEQVPARAMGQLELHVPGSLFPTEPIGEEAINTILLMTSVANSFSSVIPSAINTDYLYKAAAVTLDDRIVATWASDNGMKCTLLPIVFTDAVGGIVDDSVYMLYTLRDGDDLAFYHLYADPEAVRPALSILLEDMEAAEGENAYIDFFLAWAAGEATADASVSASSIQILQPENGAILPIIEPDGIGPCIALTWDDSALKEDYTVQIIDSLTGERLYLFTLTPNQAAVTHMFEAELFIPGVPYILALGDDANITHVNFFVDTAGDALELKPATEAEAAVNAGKPHVTVTGELPVNVRAAGDAESKLVGRAYPGETYAYLGEQDHGWYLIELEDGTTGYISPKVVTLSE